MNCLQHTSYLSTFVVQHCDESTQRQDYNLSLMRSNRTNIHNLPSEILTIIFADAISLTNHSSVHAVYKTRSCIMLVSRHFHYIVINEPELWSFIALAGPYPNFGQAGRALKLSKEALTYFYLDLRQEDTDEWCDSAMMQAIFDGYLLPHLYRTEKLTFIIDDNDIVECIYTYLSSAFAPHLKIVKLVSGTLDSSFSEPLGIQSPPSPCYTHSVSAISEGQFRCLRSLTLHEIPINYSFISPSSITSLDLSSMQAMPHDHFFDLLASIRFLRSLTLRDAGPTFEPKSRPSRTASLPHLQRLIIGSMEPSYINYLLSALQIPFIDHFGIHMVAEEHAETTWFSLIKVNERTKCFSRVRSLELFHIEGSMRMTEGEPNTYSMFLSCLPHLQHLSMRRITNSFVNALNRTQKPPLNLSSLQVLEVSSVIYSLSESGVDHPSDREPLPMKDVASLLIDLFKSHADHGRRAEWGVTRLHLDEEEWNGALTSKATLIEHLNQQGISTPIVAWDACVPFFNDFYDSGI